MYYIMAKNKVTSKPFVRQAVATSDRMERRNAVKTAPTPPATKRGIATRQRLKDAAILVLEREGYRNMRLQDVAEQADVNFSLFYHYFASKAELTHEILTEFIDSFLTPEARGILPSDPFLTLYASNKAMADVYARSPGLMRCLLHFDEEESRFSDIFRRVSRDWHRKIARSMHRRFPDVPADENLLLMVAYTLGGMIDGFLFERFVDRNPLLVEAFPDSSSAARFLAIMWYRAIYLANPDTEQLGEFSSLQMLSLTREV
jgi:TetR/AcrR family transcriptional regulator, ethionamide resistance regulator